MSGFADQVAAEAATVRQYADQLDLLADARVGVDNAAALAAGARALRDHARWLEHSVARRTVTS